jgi:hypothetical protein
VIHKTFILMDGSSLCCVSAGKGMCGEAQKNEEWNCFHFFLFSLQAMQSNAEKLHISSPIIPKAS